MRIEPPQHKLEKGCALSKEDGSKGCHRTVPFGITFTQFSLLLVCTFAFLLTSSQTVDATIWDQEFEISKDAGSENQFSADVDVEGGKIYVVWTDYEGGDSDIFFRYFDGAIWRQEVEISTDLGADLQYPPSISVDGGVAHVVWVDRGFGDLEVYYRSFNGIDWGPEQNVSVAGDPSDLVPPRIAADGGKVHVVWVDERDGDRDIYYRQFNGVSWESEMELSSDVGTEEQFHPSIAAENGRVHVVWQNDGYVYYRRFDGTSWQPEQMISNGLGYRPSFAAENGRVHVVWQNRWFPSDDVYYRHFDGTTWLPMVELGVDVPCAGRQTHADVAAEGDKVHVVWVEIRSWDNDICYGYFNGNEWLPPQEISTDSGGEEQHRPSIAVEGGYAYVVWEDEGGGDYDILLRKGIEDFTPPDSYLDPIPGYWKSTETNDIGWSANDDFGLGKVTLFYRFSSDNISWSSWEEYGYDDTVSGTSAAGTFTFTATDGDGYYEFYSVATDKSGNEENPPTTADAVLGLDTTPPTGGIVINGGDDWTNSESVTLTLEYEDNLSGVEAVRLRSDGVWDSEPWESPEQTKTWLLTSGEGSNIVYYQVRDFAGTLSSTFLDNISLDKTPPTGSIVINNGDALTSSKSVNLALTYSDSVSGVAKVRFSNEDSWSNEPWETPSTTRAWTLSSDDGIKTVYFQIIDNSGLESETYSDDIELDRSPPTVESIIPPNGATGVNVKEPIEIRFSERMNESSGTSAIDLRKDGVSVVSTIQWATDGRTVHLIPAVDLEKGVTYQIIVATKAKDIAGNMLAFPSETSFATEQDKPDDQIDTSEDNLWIWIAVIMVIISVVVIALTVWGLRRRSKGIGKKSKP
jgi:hypothetical protein